MRRTIIALAAVAMLAPVAEAQQGRDSFVGSWVGEYVCGQGVTRLELTVMRATGEGGLQARFDFSAAQANPGVPSGAYTMEGEVGRYPEFVLRPVAWLDQPDGYVMVGLKGKAFDSGRELRGDVTMEGCGAFRLRRVSEAVS